MISYVSNLSYLARLWRCSRKAYTNYYEVIKKVMTGAYPIEAIMRNGNHIKLHTRSEVHVVTSIYGRDDFEYDLDKDLIAISLNKCIRKDRKIELWGGINNGDIVSVFLYDEYRKLPVESRTVVDIGANIGDSLIYFALRGADKVIGLEPYFRSYNIAKKNIELNGMSDRIQLLLAGCASKMDSITVDPEFESDTGSSLYEFKSGVSIPLLTLEHIVKENKIESGAVLKMDCEGCEYEVILSAPTDVLRTFSFIQIEYHDGYRNLKKKLEECGYKVSINGQIAGGFISTCIDLLKSITSSSNSIDMKSKDKIRYMGYITAILT